MDELSKTIKAQLYERAGSPLLSTFVLSWAAWNYRFIAVLLSSMPVAEKVAYIDANIFLSYGDILLRGGLYPLITALLLIFVYPIPAKYVYEYWRKRQRELKEIQQRVDDEAPLTREEAREIRRGALKAAAEYEQELEQRSAEIERLRELVSDLESEATPSGKPPGLGRSFRNPFRNQSESASRLDSSQMQLLQRIANSEKGIVLHEVVSSSGTDRILSEYNLGELERRDFVKRSYDMSEGDHVVVVTHRGRTYLVNSKRRDLSSQVEQ